MSSSISSHIPSQSFAPTLEEILTDVAGGEDENALTTRELAERLGKSRSYVHRRLGELKEAGVIELVWKYVERIDGRVARVPAWRIVRKIDH